MVLLSCSYLPLDWKGGLGPGTGWAGIKKLEPMKAVIAVLLRILLEFFKKKSQHHCVHSSQSSFIQDSKLNLLNLPQMVVSCSPLSAVAFSSKMPSSIVRSKTSKVPPSMSYIEMFRFPSPQTAVSCSPLSPAIAFSSKMPSSIIRSETSKAPPLVSSGSNL